MEKMRQGLWRNVLRFLVKVSHIDLNEELLKENEYLKAEIDIYRKQLERLGNGQGSPTGCGCVWSGRCWRSAGGCATS